ncbi:hypothetical protein B484DRAFT_435160, partial [Ochromonadaceae sp. CCMP2298]
MSSLPMSSTTSTCLKDVPVILFKLATEELNHRYKACLALGSQPFIANTQWLPQCTDACEQVFKLSTLSSGKQQMGFCNTIGQNIAKAFPEQLRIGKKRVAAVSTRVLLLYDEYRRARTAYQRAAEKYLRMVGDCEGLVRSRVKAVAEAEVQAESAPPPVKDDTFMNRSMTKLLSKIAPEKKLEEQSRDQLRELDSAEKALSISSKVLGGMRSDLIKEIRKALVELEELEGIRLGIMSEGLSRFCLALDLQVQQQDRVVTEALAKALQLDCTAEASFLVSELGRDKSSRSSPSGKAGSTSSDSEDDSTQGSELDTLFWQVERLGEAMDFFRGLIKRTASALLEVAEAQASFASGAHRSLERHGFARNVSAQWSYASDYVADAAEEASRPSTDTISAAIGAVGASTMALVGTPRSAELLCRFESPSVRFGWEAVVGVLGNAADVEQRTSEVAAEEVCQQMSLVYQRLEIGRKELLDKLAVHRRGVEGARQEVRQLRAKAVKTRATLLERRATLSQVKEVLDADLQALQAQQAMQAMQGPGQVGAQVQAQVQAQMQAQVQALAAGEGGQGGQEEAGRSSLTRDSGADSLHSVEAAAAAWGLEASATTLSGTEEGAGIIGGTGAGTGTDSVSVTPMRENVRRNSIFRKGGLKQVVGFETPSDRFLRIQSQVGALEADLETISSTLRIAEKTLVSTADLARMEVSGVFDATQEFLGSDLNTVKNATECLLNWRSEALGVMRTHARHVKQAFEAVDLPSD